jgi:hypothetical protein
VSGCLCRIRVFDFLQIFSRNAVGICLDLLQSSHSNDSAAIFSASRLRLASARSRIFSSSLLIGWLMRVSQASLLQ